MVKILGNTSLIFSHTENMVERTEDNIFDQLQDHLQYSIINAQLIQEDIDFIASNMYKFIEKGEITQLLNLETNIIERIITDSKIQLESEDQLLSIINQLHLNDSSYSNLYEHIEFICLSEEKITEFLSIFNIDDLTNSTWKQISKRLQKHVRINGQIEEKRYCNSNATSDTAIIQIPYQENKNFEGIINFIQTHSKSGIFKEIKYNFI